MGNRLAAAVCVLFQRSKIFISNYLSKMAGFFGWILPKKMTYSKALPTSGNPVIGPLFSRALTAGDRNFFRLCQPAKSISQQVATHCLVGIR